LLIKTLNMDDKKRIKTKMETKTNAPKAKWNA
jgi:hypothetical protein